MKKMLPILLLFFCTTLTAQSIVGKWQTIDDKSGKARSVVEIYQKGDKFFGKVVEIYEETGGDPESVCDACDEDDPRYLKPVMGMEIIKDMQYDEKDDEYNGGEILDPESGSIYDCKIWLNDEGNLNLRGYLLFLYRTQTWLPLNE